MGSPTALQILSEAINLSASRSEVIFLGWISGNWSVPWVSLSYYWWVKLWFWCQTSSGFMKHVFLTEPKKMVKLLLRSRFDFLPSCRLQYWCLALRWASHWSTGTNISPQVFKGIPLLDIRIESYNLPQMGRPSLTWSSFAECIRMYWRATWKLFSPQTYGQQRVWRQGRPANFDVLVEEEPNNWILAVACQWPWWWMCIKNVKPKATVPFSEGPHNRHTCGLKVSPSAMSSLAATSQCKTHGFPGIWQFFCS